MRGGARQLDARVQRRQQAHQAHLAALAALEAESAEIVRRQSTLDPGDEAAVKAFNQLVATQNADADQVNEAALRSRTEADAYNADAVAHNQRCAGMLIRPEDMAAVTREQRAAAQSSAASHAAVSSASAVR